LFAAIVALTVTRWTISLPELCNALAMNERPLYPPRRRWFTPRPEGIPSGRLFVTGGTVAHVLAIIAAAVSTAAMLVVVFLTALVVSLAFRANRTADSQRRTKNL
jgi:Ca2+/Na+ antiporter